MLDINKTIILMDKNSIEGKVVRLIVNRNLPIDKGFLIEQHSSESTYYPGSDDKFFILVGDIFNDRFLESIKAKKGNFSILKFEESKKESNLLVMSRLWNQTLMEYVNMTPEEIEIMEKVSRVFDFNSIEDPSGKTMKTYIDKFVDSKTSGKDFFNTHLILMLI